MTDDHRDDELSRRFEAAVGGPELDDLRQLSSDLSLLGFGGEISGPVVRQELRRPPLPQPWVFEVRVELTRSQPRIWRRLQLRSDLTLDVVHRALQISFDWLDYHLWRFSLGGAPLDGRARQSFLCPWDVEEGEEADEGLPAASDVRLDEVLQAPGDVLFYLYDYGDNWNLTLYLENGPAADRDTPPAALVAGERAAPPEDCGGLTDGSELAEVLEHPERFDLPEADALLHSPFIALAASNLDRRLMQILDRLAHGPLGDDLRLRALALLDDREPPGAEALSRCLAPVIWFLDRAAEGDIPLTAAGYLRPTEVEVAARMLPAMRRWIGKANRESDSVPLLVFREALQSVGLLQKRKGVLRLTRAGRRAQSAPEELWNHLADRLVPSSGGFETDATLLILAFMASSSGDELPDDVIAAALTDLGWGTGSGRPIKSHDLYHLDALQILRNVDGEGGDPLARWQISPIAAELARAALYRR